MGSEDRPPRRRQAFDRQLIQEVAEQVGQRVEGVVGDRLRRLEARIGDLEDPKQPTGHAPGEVQDQPWQCRKCGALLGYYDTEDDVLRVKHKEFAAHVHLGPGGFFTTRCRSCVENNTVHWESNPEIPGMVVTDGVLVLDEATLLDLLDKVGATGSVQVELREGG